MRTHLAKLGSLVFLALALLFSVGFFSPQPHRVLRGGPYCACTYQPDTTGTVVSTGSPSCQPSPPYTFYVGSQLTVYTSDPGQCLRVPDCTEEAVNCAGTGQIQAWTNSPCKLSIQVGTRIMAIGYDWVAHEFDDDLACGQERTYSICIGSVPVIQHTNVCLNCPL
jgi:hypothetical protein